MIHGNIVRRKCASCGLIKSESVFLKNEDGVRGDICRLCTRPTEKRCGDCLLVLPLEAYSHNYSRSDMRSRVCRGCQRKRSVRYREGKPSGRGSVRTKSGELGETRAAAMRAQARDPNADYFKNYRGVPGPVVFGCVADPSKSILAFAASGMGKEPPPGFEVSIAFGDGTKRPRRVA